MEYNVLTYLIGVICGMLIMVKFKYDDKRGKGELEPGSFDKKYLLPSVITLFTLAPLLELHLVSAVVPVDLVSALFTGLIFGLGFEEGWRTAWRAFCILTHRNTQ